MGKKRRLIKSQSKFGGKHSNHPMLKKLNLEKEESITIETKQEIKIKTEEKKVEIKKIEEKPTIVKPTTEAKPAFNTKNTKVKKDTPKSRRKSTATKKIKKTKATVDKAI